MHARSSDEHLRVQAVSNKKVAWVMYERTPVQYTMGYRSETEVARVAMTF
jgi:hypothetical protein